MESNMIKLYSSKSNAQRALTTLEAKVAALNPTGRKVFNSTDVTGYSEAGESGFALVLDMAISKAALAPEFASMFEEHMTEWPEAPDPNKPLLERAGMKPYSEWVRSDIEGPVAVALGIFEKHYKRDGVHYSRSEAINEAIAAGVARNTAAGWHRNWRLSKGWPASVKAHMAQLKE
jgi:hypothetical protein